MKHKLRPRKERKVFIETLAKTGDLRAANMEAYKSFKDSIPEKVDPKKVLKKPVIREMLVDYLNEAGLDIPNLAKIHSEVAHKAKRHADKLKAVELGYKVHGAFEDESKERGGDTINFINLFIKQREERGLPIPQEVLEVKKIVQKEK